MEFVTIVADDLPGGTAVLAKHDFDPAVHRLATPAASDAPPQAPAPVVAPDASRVSAEPSIADLTVSEAIPIIEAATTVAQIDALTAQEADRPTPRQGMLKALAAKRAALSA